MREMGRGALVGAAVGVVQAAIWAASPPWDGHSGVRGPYSLWMVLAIFVVGLAVAALVRARRRSLVAFAGGIVTLALGQALWRVVPETTFYGFDRSLLGGVHLVSAVAGFAVVAWVVAVPRWRSAIAVLCVLAAVCVLAVPLREPAWRWHLARAFEWLGVPLVAPDIAEHRLLWVEAPIVGERDEPAILLDYRRAGAERGGDSRLNVQVIVRRAAVATATEACATPYYAHSWEGGAGSCRAASGDRWVRHGAEGRVAVFTHGGGALVELESHGVGEEVLLAAAKTIRPISAETLAERVIPVR